MGGRKLAESGFHLDTLRTQSGATSGARTRAILKAGKSTSWQSTTVVSVSRASYGKKDCAKSVPNPGGTASTPTDQDPLNVGKLSP